MDQKRRKKEANKKHKNLQRQIQQASMQGATTSTMTANNKCACYHKKSNVSKAQNSKSKRHVQHHYTNPVNSYTKSMRQWWQNYCTAINYHREQRRQWYEASARRAEEHKNIYNETNKSLLEQYAEEYDTSSEEEEVEPRNYPNSAPESQNELWDQTLPEEEKVDVEYLEFMEITYRHREELRLKVAAES